MRKRKILTNSLLKNKVLKCSSFHQTAAHWNEWRCLGQAFKVSKIASTSVSEDIEDVNDDVVKTGNELSNVGSNGDALSSLSNSLEEQIEDISEEPRVGCSGRQSDSSSDNNLCETIVSPSNSPCVQITSKLKGSEWVKSLPEVTNDTFPKLKRKELFRKLSSVKGGFAEQLERIISQQNFEARNCNQKLLEIDTSVKVKLKVKGVSNSCGLLISHCSLVESETVPSETSLLLSRECTIVLQNRIADALSINCGTIVTIQPPWQTLTVSEGGDKIYLIGPNIIKVKTETAVECMEQDEGPAECNLMRKSVESIQE